MDYTTVFETTGVNFNLSIFFPLLGVFIGLGISIFNIKYNKSDSIQKQLAIVFGFIFSGFAFLLSVLIISSEISNYKTFNGLIENKEYKIVEGAVENFKPMPPKPYRGTESFTVNGVLFEYCEYYSRNGFNKTSTFGGPIYYDGQQVRLRYIDFEQRNVIIKVELKK